MTEVSSGLRAVLARPAIYELWSDLVGARRGRAGLVNRYVTPQPGDRILDLGCGPGELLSYLPDSVSYTGVDISPQYIAAARQRFRGRGEFEVGDASRYVASTRRFDRVVVFGVLHHLDDRQVASVFATAADIVAERGRMMTVDPVYAPGQSRIARAIIDRDRGQHVRDADSYAGLARAAWESVRVTVRHDLLRIPYSHCILEAQAPLSGNAR
jgi:SAM-dependent methyltransferase